MDVVHLPSQLCSLSPWRDHTLHLPALGGERPDIRFAARRAASGVLDQTKLLQTREQLRDLALVCDSRPVRDGAVGGAGARRDGHQYLYRAIGEPHLQITERVRPALEAVRLSKRCWAVQLLVSRMPSQVGKHDYRHQRIQQVHESLGLLCRQASVKHRQHSADYALRDQCGWLTPSLCSPTAAIDDPDQRVHDTPATLERL